MLDARTWVSDRAMLENIILEVNEGTNPAAACLVLLETIIGTRSDIQQFPERTEPNLALARIAMAMLYKRAGKAPYLIV